MPPYDPRAIEPKWQEYWERNRTFRVLEDPARPKLYVLDMFPYPSGEGLHVGHPEGYTATDMWCRYQRMRGFNVLHPMGYDAFGLPAEQYAIQTGTHPRVSTERNVANIRRQIKRRGDHPVARIPLRQRLPRTTAYADRLVEDLEFLDWPPAIKEMQRHWVGRSEGAEIDFRTDRGVICVYTTRPDTLFGATYMVLAP